MVDGGGGGGWWNGGWWKQIGIVYQCVDGDAGGCTSVQCVRVSPPACTSAVGPGPVLSPRHAAASATPLGSTNTVAAVPYAVSHVATISVPSNDKTP